MHTLLSAEMVLEWAIERQKTNKARGHERGCISGLLWMRERAAGSVSAPRRKVQSRVLPIDDPDFE